VVAAAAAAAAAVAAAAFASRGTRKEQEDGELKKRKRVKIYQRWYSFMPTFSFALSRPVKKSRREVKSKALLVEWVGIVDESSH